MRALRNRAERISGESARGVNDGENLHEIGTDSIHNAVGWADDLTQARLLQFGHDATGQWELDQALDRGEENALSRHERTAENQQ